MGAPKQMMTSGTTTRAHTAGRTNQRRVKGSVLFLPGLNQKIRHVSAAKFCVFLWRIHLEFMFVSRERLEPVTSNLLSESEGLLIPASGRVCMLFD